MSYPRKSLPMYFPPPPFSLPDAVVCADLVITAYKMYHQWIKDGSQPKWVWTPPSGTNFKYSAAIWGTTWSFPQLTEPFAFVAYSTAGRTAGNIYFVARGSESWSDWLDDSDMSQKSYSLVPNYGNVHAGFMDIYASMSKATIGAVNATLQQLGANAKALYFTAHSLGSALSTLAVPDVLANSKYKNAPIPPFHYPLASPRVGDPDFYYQYSLLNIPTFRVIDTEDIVPDLPTSIAFWIDQYYIYKHIGLEVSYTAQYDSDAGNHNYKSSYYYALENPTQPEGPIVQQIAEDAATAQFLRLKKENDLLKRLLAEREMALALLRSQTKPQEAVPGS